MAPGYCPFSLYGKLPWADELRLKRALAMDRSALAGLIPHLGRAGSPAKGVRAVVEDGAKIAGPFSKAFLWDQIEQVRPKSPICPKCRWHRAIHDDHTRVLGTLLAGVWALAARLCRFCCNAKSTALPGGPFPPLTCFFPHRANPEPQRFHAGLGPRHSCRDAARLRKSFRPANRPITGQRGTDWAALPTRPSAAAGLRLILLTRFPTVV